MFKKSKCGKFDAKFLAISGLVLVVLFACFVVADMTVLINNQPSSVMQYSSVVNKAYTFTISATETINQTNFTLVGLTYVLSTFNTNAYNTSAMDNSTNAILNITNNNATGLIPASATLTFTFNATGTDGVKGIKITSLTRAGSINVTYTNVTIDTINPNFFGPIADTGFNASTTINFANLSQTWINVNVTVNDTNLANITFNLYQSGVAAVYNSTILTTIASAETRGAGINWTNLANGVYYFNFTAIDYALRANSSATRKVTLDTNGPAVTSITLVNGTGISSGVYIFNVTLNDALMNASTAGSFFNVTNSSGGQNQTLPIVRGGSTDVWSNASFNASRYAEGTYFLKVWANDTINNLNNSEYVTFYVDRTAPSAITTAAVATEKYVVNFSIAITDATSGVNSTCTINRGGAIVTGTGLSQTVSETGLSCNTAYTYTISCTDRAGNSNATGTYTVTTSSCNTNSGTSGSSSGGTPSTQTAVESVAGYTKTMIVAEEFKFSLPSVADTTVKESHSVFIQSLIGDTLTIKVASTPQFASMKVGETKTFDVNEDSYYDVSVTFNSIISGAASLTIKSIKEAVPGTPAAEEAAAIAEAAAAAEEKAGMSALAWTGIGVVILLIIGLVLWFSLRRTD